LRTRVAAVLVPGTTHASKATLPTGVPPRRPRCRLKICESGRRAVRAGPPLRSLRQGSWAAEGQQDRGLSADPSSRSAGQGLSARSPAGPACSAEPLGRPHPRSFETGTAGLDLPPNVPPSWAGRLAEGGPADGCLRSVGGGHARQLLQRRGGIRRGGRRHANAAICSMPGCRRAATERAKDSLEGQRGQAWLGSAARRRRVWPPTGRPAAPQGSRPARHRERSNAASCPTETEC